MHAEAAGLKRAGFRIVILAGSYLLLVFLIVTFEVASGAAPFLRWAYLISSLAYIIGVIGICLVDTANKLVALSIAVLAILAGLLFGLVAGVGFKSLIGGTI